jgi:hypothetical protein
MRILKEIDYTDPKRTYLITGCARSGTSILSGILHLNGIDMGKIGKGGRYEDVNFVDYFDKMEKLGRSKVIKNYLDLVKKRNSEYDEWGLKMPNIPHFFSDIKSEIINPVFIISFRNPLAIAESASKYGNGWGREHLDAAIQHNKLILDMIKDNPDTPCILSSFEDMKSSVVDQVKELEIFLGKSFDVDIIKQFLSKETYNYLTV